MSTCLRCPGGRPPTAASRPVTAFAGLWRDLRPAGLRLRAQHRRPWAPARTTGQQLFPGPPEVPCSVMARVSSGSGGLGETAGLRSVQGHSLSCSPSSTQPSRHRNPQPMSLPLPPPSARPAVRTGSTNSHRASDRPLRQRRRSDTIWDYPPAPGVRTGTRNARRTIRRPGIGQERAGQDVRLGRPLCTTTHVNPDNTTRPQDCTDAKGHQVGGNTLPGAVVVPNPGAVYSLVRYRAGDSVRAVARRVVAPREVAEGIGRRTAGTVRARRPGRRRNRSRRCQYGLVGAAARSWSPPKRPG